MNKYLIQDYFYESVIRYPDYIAVKDGQESYTYRQLYEDSIRISDTLIRSGARSGDFVALYLDKSYLSLAGIFGSLFASCTYIPLDTKSAPPKRISAILNHCKPSYLLIQADTVKKVQEVLEADGLKDITLILMDRTDVWEQAGSLQKANPLQNADNRVIESIGSLQQVIGMNWNSESEELHSIRPRAVDEDTAYILYTSGSTGQPKGVMLSHRNALTFVEWSMNFFRPTSSDHFISITPFHFDLSVFDIFVSLGAGATLSIPSPEAERNPLSLLEVLKRERISYIYSVPSLWTIFLTYRKEFLSEMTELKKILFAGEVFQPKYLKEVMEALPWAKFYNLYGLIETNVCTCYQIKNLPNDRQESVPIGFPCENSAAIIIDENNTPVEEGQTGELCVRGSIIMKGYLHDKERTDNSFRLVNLGKRTEIFYCTGDMARKNRDGAFEYLGRKDNMIKKGGFRVELKEIEGTLYMIPEVEEAVVIAIRNSNQEVLICAGVVLNRPALVTYLKKAVGGYLPHYMIPDFIKIFPVFNKSSNGKFDRQKIKDIFKEMI